ncbi:MAG: hypothetical protein ACP5HQ_06850 [Thermoprotei archaeon]
MLKHYEFTRHSMGEPLVTVSLYKKAEGDKVVAVFRLLVFRENQYVVIYEGDELKGADLVACGKGDGLTQLLKFYEPERDDLIVSGERERVEAVLEEYFSRYQG